MLNELKRAMDCAGLDAAALARRINVNKSTVSRWMAGEFRPSPHHFPLIAVALGMQTQQAVQLFTTRS